MAECRAPTYSMYCIVSIHLYSASCFAVQSEALPVRATQREESCMLLVDVNGVALHDCIHRPPSAFCNHLSSSRSTTSTLVFILSSFFMMIILSIVSPPQSM